MGPHVDAGPYDAGRWCYACCHGSATRRPTLDRVHPTCFRASVTKILFYTKLTVHMHTQKKIQIDSLVPAYACPAADAVRNAFQAVPAWTDHLRGNASLKARLDAVFGTAGLNAWASWCKVQRVLYIVACSVAQIP